jgi:hypothetical protein
MPRYAAWIEFSAQYRALFRLQSSVGRMYAYLFQGSAYYLPFLHALFEAPMASSHSVNSEEASSLLKRPVYTLETVRYSRDVAPHRQRLYIHYKHSDAHYISCYTLCIVHPHRLSARHVCLWDQARTVTLHIKTKPVRSLFGITHIFCLLPTITCRRRASCC